MISWRAHDKVDLPAPQGLGWLLLALRAGAMVLVIYGLLIPFWGMRLLGQRKAAQYIVQFACIISLRIMGIPLVVSGQPMEHHGAVVCNHASWLDIFSLNAAQRIYFVAKDDVGDWPGIGILARSTGTVFIKRRQIDAKRHTNQLSERLSKGDKLLFFPEGTSTDGQRVLPFRSSLFAAFMDAIEVDDLWIQPVTLSYIAPKDQEKDYYGFWGDTNLAPHLMMVLATKKQGRIEVAFHTPIKVSDHTDRKKLSKLCEDTVRGGLVL